MKFGIRKEIKVDLDKKTFSLKIKDKKKLFIVSGKKTQGVVYADDFKIEGQTLVYKPTLSSHTFEAVDKAFDKMLNEDE